MKSLLSLGRPCYEIEPADVGQRTHRIFGRVWRVEDWIGRVLPLDVGKRVYLVGGVLCVENDQQRADRDWWARAAVPPNGRRP